MGFTSTLAKAQALIDVEKHEHITYRKVLNGDTQNRKFNIKTLKQNGRVVYCIEPMIDITEDAVYKSTSIDKASQVTNIDTKTLNYVNLVAFYGYGYEGRTDKKWYAITQLLIWKALEPSGDYFFTTGLYGERIHTYDEDFKALKSDVQNHLKRLQFEKDIYISSIGREQIIKSLDASFDDYLIEKTGDINVSSEGNLLKINSDKAGEYEINFSKKARHIEEIPIVYFDDVSQNLLAFGKYEEIDEKLKLKFISGEIKIIKKDLDKGNFNTGNSSFIGTTFKLTDENGKEYIKEITNGNEIIFNDLPLGTYTLEEIKAGTGYELNKEKKIIVLDENNADISIEFINKVISKELEITKYKKDINYEIEPGIKFNIVGINHDFNETFVTNEKGKVNLKLPYGNYKVKQLNTTPGYAFVKDFQIEVLDAEKDSIELINFKIPKAGAVDFRFIILMLLIVSYVKIYKKNYNT